MQPLAFQGSVKKTIITELQQLVPFEGPAVGQFNILPQQGTPEIFWLDDATTENKQTSSHIQEQRAKLLCVTLRVMNECLGIL